MKRNIYFGLFIVAYFTTGSCVSPYIPKLNPEDANPIIVVEGKITDQEGPFIIKLTQSSPVSYTDNPLPVDHADMKIIDDQGHSFQLYNYGSGIYTTQEKNLRAVSGNRYTLIFTTADDGIQYTSTPVLVQEAPAIDSLYFEQVTYPKIVEGKASVEDWVNILVDAHDSSGVARYWRWDYEETFEGLKKLNEFLWLKCWVRSSSSSILVASTKEKPADEIKSFIIRSIGPGSPELFSRYSILVRQYSIDADLYNYLKKLRDFNENPGGIYNKIPIPIFGNITCCDGSKKALGYFTASSVKEKRFFISRSDHYTIETAQISGPEVCTSWYPPSYW